VYGTNAAGDLVGYRQDDFGHFHAFVWNSVSGLSLLGTLGGEDSWGMAINEEDAVAGHSATASGFVHAFVEERGQLVDLGTLGGASSYAYGINDSGAVVGYSVTGQGNLHAFIAIDGRMLDLNAVVPQDSGWLLTAAYGIDNGGRITGVGVANGTPREFRLDPITGAVANLNGAAVPEGGTLALAGMALAAMRCLNRRAFRMSQGRSGKHGARSYCRAGYRSPQSNLMRYSS
jgi:probable HAF family extracellular repeat protein